MIIKLGRVRMYSKDKISHVSQLEKRFIQLLSSLITVEHGHKGLRELYDSRVKGEDVDKELADLEVHHFDLPYYFEGSRHNFVHEDQEFSPDWSWMKVIGTFDELRLKLKVIWFHEVKVQTAWDLSSFSFTFSISSWVRTSLSGLRSSGVVRPYVFVLMGKTLSECLQNV